jgi:hypothetical protein
VNAKQDEVLKKQIEFMKAGIDAGMKPTLTQKEWLSEAEAKIETYKNMNFFYVEFDDGDFFTTGFNGTLEDAKKYYLGKEFERFDEKMHKCVKVEESEVRESEILRNSLKRLGKIN